MKTLRAWILRMAGMFSRKQSESEFADELDSHLQMNIDDNLRAGMTPEQARREALRELGGVEKTKQAYRERGTLPLKAWKDCLRCPKFQACDEIAVLRVLRPGRWNESQSPIWGQTLGVDDLIQLPIPRQGHP